MLFCGVEDQGWKVSNLMESVLVHLLWPAAASSSDLHGAVVVVACYGFYWMVVVSPTWEKLVGKCNLAWIPRSHSDLEWEFPVFMGRYYCMHCWCCHWTVSNEGKVITVHSSAKNKREKTNFVSSAYINFSSIFFSFASWIKLLFVRVTSHFAMFLQLWEGSVFNHTLSVWLVEELLHLWYKQVNFPSIPTHSNTNAACFGTNTAGRR